MQLKAAACCCRRRLQAAKSLDSKHITAFQTKYGSFSLTLLVAIGQVVLADLLLAAHHGRALVQEGGWGIYIGTRRGVSEAARRRLLLTMCAHISLTCTCAPSPLLQALQVLY